MAHKKGVGSSKNGRESESKRLGVKIFGGQAAKAGNIIIRQRGTKFHPGEGVGIGKDHTIFAMIDGTVAFRTRKHDKTFVSVFANGEEEVVTAPPKAARKVKTEEVPQTAAEPVIEETVSKAEAAEAPQVEATGENAGKADDLKKIEGIGPKISEILSDAGLTTYSSIAEAGAERISEILAEAGNRYKSFDPTTWPQQAKLAAEGKWDELSALQDELKGGRPAES